MAIDCSETRYRFLEPVCRVEVLREALRTKSRWWRKCPIQVCHSNRQLLHGETSFALFAEGSAAKEQWYAALEQAAGSAPARQAVEDTYASFCARARAAGGATRYPQVGFRVERTRRLTDVRRRKPDVSSRMEGLQRAGQDVGPRCSGENGFQRRAAEQELGQAVYKEEKRLRKAAVSRRVGIPEPVADQNNDLAARQATVALCQ